MLPGMRGASFRSRKRLAVSSKRYSCSKNIEAPGQHQQCVEQVAVVTEAIPASGDRLQILSLDRRVEVVGYVLDNFVTRTARCDIPAVAPDWQCERQEQRGDLRVGAHRAVRVYRVRPGQLGTPSRVDERGPRSQTGVAVTYLSPIRAPLPCARNASGPNPESCVARVRGLDSSLPVCHVMRCFRRWERSRFRTANLEASDLGVHRSGWISVVVSHWPGHLEVMPFAPTPEQCRAVGRRSSPTGIRPDRPGRCSQLRTPKSLCRQAPR